MSQTRIAVYPGTFDPITNGHIDIIRRAARLADRLVIGVSTNIGKGPLFDVHERVAMVSAEVAALDLPAGNGKVEVRAFDTLLMHFAPSMGAGMNARLDPAIETVFLMASDRHQFISSRFVKEIGRLGGDITSFVSSRVAERLAARFAEERSESSSL